MKRWSFFLTLGITFFLLAVSSSPVASEGGYEDPISRARERQKSKNPSSVDREKEKEKERLKASINKMETFKDWPDREREYERFFALFYQDDAVIDKEERIFLEFKRAELELNEQKVRQLEAQVVANGHKILSREEDRDKE